MDDYSYYININYQIIKEYRDMGIDLSGIVSDLYSIYDYYDYYGNDYKTYDLFAS